MSDEWILEKQGIDLMTANIGFDPVTPLRPAHGLAIRAKVADQSADRRLDSFAVLQFIPRCIQ
jgi:hypothetical protein